MRGPGLEKPFFFFPNEEAFAVGGMDKLATGVNAIGDLAIVKIEFGIEKLCSILVGDHNRNFLFFLLVFETRQI